MEKIVLASNNAHKIKEIKEVLKSREVLSLNDIEFYDEVEETGETFFDNALLKARAISEFLKSKGLEYDVIADDSGLCCNGLNGAPGVYSARYSGVHGDDAANRKKLIEALSTVEDKSAYFTCTIVLYHPNGEYKSFVGECSGTIISEEKGNLEFGYDPIFLSDDLGITFGEASSDDKNSVSHRGRAIKKLQEDIENN